MFNRMSAGSNSCFNSINTTRMNSNFIISLMSNLERCFQFIREVISELRKVVWPTREEATRLTVMVIVVAASVGVLLGIIDFAFSLLIRNVLI